MHVYKLNTKKNLYLLIIVSTFQVKCWSLPSIHKAVYFSKIVIVLKIYNSKMYLKSFIFYLHKGLYNACDN